MSGRRTAHGLAKFTAVAAVGADRAAHGLTELLGHEVVLDATGVHFGGSSRLFELVGGPGVTVVGVYLRMGGRITGHVMLLFELEQARSMVDQLLELEAGTTEELDDLAYSALGEVGNITAAAFLNELGNAVDIDMRLSPPTVMEEMAGALLDSVLAEIAYLGGETLILETVFIQAGTQIRGFILIAPDPDSLSILMDHLAAA
ncbi:MAG: chemotaxis protein CheX [Dehalococcoidia bacterium]